MARLTRPGGVVALHEAVASTQRVDPPHPAQDRLVEILASASARQGIDRNLGLRAPRMLRAAGVTQIEVVPLVHVYPPGHDRRRLVLDFVENARARIVEDGLASESELSDLTAALRSHLDDPGTLVVSSLFLQVWGRKSVP